MELNAHFRYVVLTGKNIYGSIGRELQSSFKGELKRFFYGLKVFICPKLRQVSKGNFHRKAPKRVKNQVKGTKIDQIRTKWHPTF